jgi:hypothetical protein
MLLLCLGFSAQKLTVCCAMTLLSLQYGRRFTQFDNPSPGNNTVPTYFQQQLRLGCVSLHYSTLYHVTRHHVTRHASSRHTSSRHPSLRHTSSRHTSRFITSHVTRHTSHVITSSRHASSRHTSSRHHVITSSRHHVTLHHVTLHRVTLHHSTAQMGQIGIGVSLRVFIRWFLSSWHRCIFACVHHVVSV